MKKYHITLAALAVLLLMIFDWFHVGGREIEHLKDISSDCTVTVMVYGRKPTTGIGTGGYENEESFTLTEVQTEKLKQSFLSAGFRRNPAHTITWKSEKTEKRYDIFVDFNDGQRFISIHMAGNHHLSITDQFDGNFLMIGKKTDLEGELLAILAAE